MNTLTILPVVFHQENVETTAHSQRNLWVPTKVSERNIADNTRIALTDGGLAESRAAAVRGRRRRS